MDDLTLEILRYTVVILTAPIWMPFAKALWQELNRALRDEGGMFGRVPSPRELERIEDADALLEDPLISEPRFGPNDRRGTRFRDTSASARPGQRAGAQRAGTQRGGLGGRGTFGGGRKSGFRN